MGNQQYVPHIGRYPRIIKANPLQGQVIKSQIIISRLPPSRLLPSWLFSALGKDDSCEEEGLPEADTVSAWSCPEFSLPGEATSEKSDLSRSPLFDIEPVHLSPSQYRKKPSIPEGSGYHPACIGRSRCGVVSA